MEDPLLAYDELLNATDDQQPDVIRRLGDRVALRFPDPEQRTDAAGCTTPHEFVLSGPEAGGISSLNEGREGPGRWSPRSTRKCGARQRLRQCGSEEPALLAD